MARARRARPTTPVGWFAPRDGGYRGLGPDGRPVPPPSSPPPPAPPTEAGIHRVRREHAAADTFIAGIDPDSECDGRHLRAVSAARATLDQAVREARLAGDSWSMIAIALGTTENAVRSQYDAYGTGEA
jgi:hypothetical protein